MGDCGRFTESDNEGKSTVSGDTNKQSEGLACQIGFNSGLIERVTHCAGENLYDGSVCYSGDTRLTINPTSKDYAAKGEIEKIQKIIDRSEEHTS